MKVDIDNGKIIARTGGRLNCHIDQETWLKIVIMGKRLGYAEDDK